MGDIPLCCECGDTNIDRLEKCQWENCNHSVCYRHGSNTGLMTPVGSVTNPTGVGMRACICHALEIRSNSQQREQALWTEIYSHAEARTSYLLREISIVRFEIEALEYLFENWVRISERNRHEAFTFLRIVTASNIGIMHQILHSLRQDLRRKLFTF